MKNSSVPAPLVRLELTTAPYILNEKGDNKRTNASKVEGGTCTDNGHQGAQLNEAGEN